MVELRTMSRPSFLKSGALGHLKFAAAHLRRALGHVGLAVQVVVSHTVSAAVALVILFEEWGWRPLANLLGVLARLRPIAALETLVRGLPPYAALVVFALPSVLLLPLKLLALYLVAQGKTALAAGLFVGAKVVGTALVARIYMLTETSLMRLAWFKRAYDTLMPLKAALTAWVRESWVWRYARVIKARARRAIEPVVRTARALARRLLRRPSAS
jgi:hypothetical protein